jgi:hypothetical protein
MCSGVVRMNTALLLGYAIGIITCAFLSGYPENFKPTITENPGNYLLVGVGIGAFAIALDFLGAWF